MDNIEISKESLLDGVNPNNAVLILMSLLDGITGYSLNDDAWFLASCRATDLCKRMGLPEKEI